MLPVTTSDSLREALWHRGRHGIEVKHTSVQVLTRSLDDCVILNNFFSLLEIQSTQMELILSNPENDVGYTS